MQLLKKKKRTIAYLFWAYLFIIFRLCRFGLTDVTGYNCAKCPSALMNHCSLASQLWAFYGKKTKMCTGPAWADLLRNCNSFSTQKQMQKGREQVERGYILWLAPNTEEELLATWRGRFDPIQVFSTFDLQSSRLNICYYHQDLHQDLLHINTNTKRHTHTQRNRGAHTHTHTHIQ